MQGFKHDPKFWGLPNRNCFVMIRAFLKKGVRSVVSHCKVLRLNSMRMHNSDVRKISGLGLGLEGLGLGLEGLASASRVEAEANVEARIKSNVINIKQSIITTTLSNIRLVILQIMSCLHI